MTPSAGSACGLGDSPGRADGAVVAPEGLCVAPVCVEPDAALRLVGCREVEQFAQPVDELALALGHDDPTDDACVLHVGFETLMSLADQAGEILGHGQCDTDGREDQKIERPLQRRRLFLYGVHAVAIVGVRHSPGRASSSCRQAGSGV